MTPFSDTPYTVGAVYHTVSCMLRSVPHKLLLHFSIYMCLTSSTAIWSLKPP